MYQSPWSWTFNLHAGHSWNDVLTHSKFESLTSFPQVHDKNGVNCLQQRKGLFPLVFAQTLELLGKVETEHRRHLDWSSSLLCSDLSFWLHYTNHQFWWCQQTFPVVFVLRSQSSVTVLTLKKFHETLPAAVRWFPASFSFLSNRCSLKLFQKSILWKRFRITIAVAEYKQGRMDVIKSPGPGWLLWYFHIQPWVIFAMEDPWREVRAAGRWWGAAVYLQAGPGLSWESHYTSHYSGNSVHLTLWHCSLLSHVTMLKWLHVTGKDQQINQLPHKKNNKNKSSLKHEVTSEDPVAVIDNYKFNITR